MTDISTFIFQGWEMVSQKKTILFHYTIRHKEEIFDFTDTLVLPSDVPSNIPHRFLETLLNNCLLMFGISYWKLFCPQNIEIANFSLTKEQADFWNTVYTKGLGQFFYENKIDYTNLVQFPFDEKKAAKSLVAFPRQDRSLLPVGGGKDSIVAAELLKKAGKDFTMLTIYTGLPKSTAQELVVRQIGKESLIIKRTLDPQLFVLNKRKDTYNGHVPAVAMHSFLSVLLAALYDYRYVIFANEESANYGNIAYLGQVVNHQWSKSLEFEALFQEYLSTYITHDITYFSILRPFSEIKIAQLFSQHPHYFPMFVSCNRGYSMMTKGDTNWCGHCPKCAFVFAMLSAYVPKQEVLQIFGKNLFADEKLVPLYKELLGVEAFKPFECVGTPEEVRMAFYLAWEKGDWKDDPMMQIFAKDVLPHMQNNKEQEEQLLALHTVLLPDGFGKVVEI